MTRSDFFSDSTEYLYAVATYTVVLTLGLVGNAVVFGINLANIRRLPGYSFITVNMNQVAIGMQSIANMMVGTFSVSWFALVGLVGTTHLRQVHPACRIVSAVFVWTSVAYLMGLLAMAVDRMLEVRRVQLRLPGDAGGGIVARSIGLTSNGVWLTVVGFCLYTATVGVVLSASTGFSLETMTMLCTVHIDDRLRRCARIPLS